MHSKRDRDPRESGRRLSTRRPLGDAADEPDEPATKAPADPQSIDPLLTDFDLERLTGRARSSWQKARLTGDGPPFVRLGRLVRYRFSDFEAWLASRPRLRSTSETADRAA
jgi:predicted DNA-binding transcriptional regulator AlpA